MDSVTRICVPFKVMMGRLLYSLLYGLMTVFEDFCAETDILFVASQFSRYARYNCRLLAAMVMFGSDETVVRSSAYDEIETFGC